MRTPSVTLPADAVSVPAARRFVRDRLVDLGAVGACDDAEALVSELATNAVLHARTPFTVEVSRQGETVRVRVLDASPSPPRVRDYGTDATTGRGMRLVAAMSSDWGSESQSGGKGVWFELPAAGSTASVDGWHEDPDVESLFASFGDVGPPGSEPVGKAA